MPEPRQAIALSLLGELGRKHGPAPWLCCRKGTIGLLLARDGKTPDDTFPPENLGSFHL